MWRELELRWERRRLWLLAQTWSRRRSGSSRLAGARQPEGGGKCWRTARRMHLGRQGQGKLASQGRHEHRRIRLQQSPI
jgi:hypothetical protein